MEYPNGLAIAVKKTITWRIIAIIVTIVTIYAMTGEIGLSIGLTVMLNVIKTVLYFAHELMWK